MGLQFGEFPIDGFAFFLQLGQGAVAQLGGLVEIAYPLGFLFFDFGRFDFFFDRAQLLDRRFFILPMGFEAARSLFQIVNFLFELSQALLRGFVLFTLERLAFDFQLHDFALDLVDLDGHAVDFNSQSRGCFID